MPALLAGLLSHVGMREGESREYTGARNAKFVLAPGSVLTKRPPRWIVVADLVETSRLYGRTAARIEPEVIERVAGHLVQRSYSEPHWDPERGAVLAYERVTLYGLALVARRRVGYAAVDPEVCRELFIRHALVEGDWRTRHHFFADNARMRTEVTELEERARRRDLLVGDEEIYAFYDARIPPDVLSAKHFDGWWRKQRHRTPDLLTMTRADLLRVSDADTDRPDHWQSGDLGFAVDLPLRARGGRRRRDGAHPGGSAGTTGRDAVRLAGSGTARGTGHRADSLLAEGFASQLRSSPDTARALLADIDPAAVSGSFIDWLQGELHRRTGVLVPLSAFDIDKLPAHLRVTFAVQGADGAEVARGKDLGALQTRLAGTARRAVAEAVAGEWERDGLRTWPEDLDELPRALRRSSTGSGCGLSGLCRGRGRRGHQTVRRGVRTRCRCCRGSPQTATTIGTVTGETGGAGLDPRTRLMLGANPDGSLSALLDDCADAAVDLLAPSPVWARSDFDRLRRRIAVELPGATAEIVSRVQRVLIALQAVQVALPEKPTLLRLRRLPTSGVSSRSWCRRILSPLQGPTAWPTWPLPHRHR